MQPVLIHSSYLLGSFGELRSLTTLQNNNITIRGKDNFSQVLYTVNNDNYGNIQIITFLLGDARISDKVTYANHNHKYYDQ